MYMMQKMSLLALAMCAAGAVSTAAHAEDKSWGTASAKVTVNAPQEWKIEKVKDGKINLGDNNYYSDMSVNVTNGGTATEFKITNGTQTAGKYYITGSGSSFASNGDIFMVKDDDATVKIKIKPFMSDGDKTNFEWVGDANKYRTRTDVAANGTQNFIMSPAAGGQTLTPGSYTMTIELFTPSA